MKENNKYVQCSLLRGIDQYTISWIPEHCAIVGATVMLGETRQSDPIKYVVQKTYGKCDESVLNQIEGARKNRAYTIT